MEVENIVIPKKIDADGQAFYFIREEGIKLLEQLTGRRWTDFNSHDPGITIWEHLCYALTELDLKANLEIKDLISFRVASNSPHELFPLEVALPAAPLTINDYRKYFIDIPNVENAWLGLAEFPEQEVYLDNLLGELTYTVKDELTWKGLYHLYLELANDNELFGDLNRPVLENTIEIGGTNIKVLYNLSSLLDTANETSSYWENAIIFPDWTSDLNITNATTDPPDTALSPLPNEDIEDYSIKIKVDYDATGIAPTHTVIGLTVKLENGVVPTPAIESQIINELTTSGNNSFWKTFNQKIMTVFQTVSTAKNHFLKQRNLCEDLVRIQTVRVQEIGISGQINININEDVEEVLARIFIDLEDFIDPNIVFQFFDAFEDSANSIYDGPLLSQGYLSDESIRDNLRNSIVYISDLIRIILARKSVNVAENSTSLIGEQAVLGVQNLIVSNYINGQLVVEGVKNCLSLFNTNLYKPRFSVERSVGLQVKRGDEVIAWDIDLIAQKMKQLRNEKASNRVLPTNSNKEEIINPTDLETYYSIQREFPEVYGIGDGTLPSAASPKRKAQAKQLKGYLLQLEQLLGDGAKQVAQIRAFLSFTTFPSESYATQPLTDIPNWQDLIASNYLDTSELDEFRAENNTQRLFQLQTHLNARLGEDQRSVARWMLDNGLADEWIADQGTFIQNQPQLSRERGLAIDFNALEELSGYEVRVSRWMGLRNEKRRKLHNDINKIVNDTAPFFFTIQGTDILYSSAEYPTETVAIAAAERFVNRGLDIQYYIIDDTNPSNVVLHLSLPATIVEIGTYPNQGEADAAAELFVNRGLDIEYYITDDTIVLRLSLPATIVEIGTYPNLGEAERIQRQLILVLQDLLQDIYEGFHALEHILLRPKGATTAVNDVLLNIKKDNGGLVLSGEENPYTARMSVFVPNWAKRFQDSTFKRLLVNAMRREAPAHLIVDIYFLDRAKMTVFEEVYFNWLNAYQQFDFESATYLNALTALVAELNDIRTTISVE